MASPRSALTPDALAMLEAIAQTGSFAAGARHIGKVPSAVTYAVRQLEEALDVLLFDRTSRQARLTAAGRELLEEGKRLLEQIDAVANRVKRVASGWETTLTIAVDDVIAQPVLLELCESFYASASPPPATRLRIRTEVMAGVWEALVTGRADLAIGVSRHAELPPSVARQELGSVGFVFVVAPHHPLATVEPPLGDCTLVSHRAIAVADSAERLTPVTVNLLPGQDVLTVADMRVKIDALLRGLGCGFVPEAMVREHLREGRLVVKELDRAREPVALGYAWRAPGSGNGSDAPQSPALGLALRWWLRQLDSPATRQALLERHQSRATR